MSYASYLGIEHSAALAIDAPPPLGTYPERVTALSPNWHLPLDDASGTTASADVGASGAYVGSPQLSVTTLAQDDASGKSVGFNGTSQYITVTSPLTGPDLTIDLMVQIDNIDKPKHVLITSTSLANGLSIEVVPGGQLRVWSRVGSSAQVFQGNIGDVPQGEAVKITYQRVSGNPAWSQRCYVNAVLKVEDVTQRTWATVTGGTWYIGSYGVATDLFDGLMGHVLGWNRVLSLSEIQSLVHTSSVAWAENIDAGSVPINDSTQISVLQGGWHGRLPLATSVTDTGGNLVNPSASGNQITITAGATAGDNTTFTYEFTDANGKTSQTRTVTIDVTGVSSGRTFTLLSGSPIITTFKNLGTVQGSNTAKFLSSGGAAVYDMRGTTFDNTLTLGSPSPPSGSSRSGDIYQPSKSVQVSTSHNGGGIFGATFRDGYGSNFGAYHSEQCGRRYPAPGNHGGQVLLNNTVTNFTIEGCRFYRCWDPIRSTNGGNNNYHVYRCWITKAYDDVIENDDYSRFAIEECLIEHSYCFLSERSAAPSPSVSTHIVVIRNCLVALKGLYSVAEDGTVDGGFHYSFFKLNGNAHRFQSLNTIYWFDKPSHHMNASSAWNPFKNLSDYSKFSNWSGNTIVWRGEAEYGPYPWPVPPGTTVTTNQSVWDAAVAAWKAANPHVPRIPGVDT